MSWNPDVPFNDLAPLPPPGIDLDPRRVLKATVEARAALATIAQERAFGVVAETNPAGQANPASGHPPTDQLTLLDLGDPPPRPAPPAPQRATPQQPTERPAGTRPDVIQCHWCGATSAVPDRGRVPKWCSDTCRHRAWEQRRAAASGLCAIDVVERVVEVVRTQRVVEEVRVEVLAEARPRSSSDYPSILLELSERLDTGRIYDRDLASLTPALTALLDAFNRRCR